MERRLVATTLMTGAGKSPIAMARRSLVTARSSATRLAATATTIAEARYFSSSGKLSTASREGEQRRVPHIMLYTGTHCSLCDVVKETLREAAKAPETPKFEVSTYNIHDDSLPDVQRWRRAYQYDIPVIHLDGAEIARHRLDKAVLLEKLREAIEQ